MKKIIMSGLLGLLILMISTGCEKNNFAIDKEIVVPPFAKFNTRLASDTMATYYIRSTGEAFKIPIGVTNVSSADRTIQLCYSSRTATAGQQYNAPATITIPAGKTIDSVSIQGLFAGYPISSRVDTLKVTICGGDFGAAAFKSSYYVIMRKYCDVVLASLMGNYSNTNEYSSSGAFSYGPYTTQISALTPVTATTATATLVNLYDDGWVPITATFNWTNPANFTVSIANQPTGKGYNVRTNSTAVSTFSSCDRSVSLSIDLVSTTGSVLASNYKIVMK